MIVNYIEGDDNNDQEYVKNVLSAALKTKLEEIEELRKQDEKDKKKFEKMKKREKELYKREKFGRIDENGVKKRRQTLTEQETNAHEAFQLLLSEHNKKVIARAKKKLSVVTSLMKLNAGQL